MFNFTFKCLKTYGRPLTFPKKCKDVIDGSAYLPPQSKKTLKHVFSFVTVEQTVVTPPGNLRKVFFFQLTSCILNSALKKHIQPICILHLSWDLTARVCHRYPDPKLSVPMLPFPLSGILAFLIKQRTVLEQGKLFLLWNKKISESDYITAKYRKCLWKKGKPWHQDNKSTCVPIQCEYQYRPWKGTSSH